MAIGERMSASVRSAPKQSIRAFRYFTWAWGVILVQAEDFGSLFLVVGLAWVGVGGVAGFFQLLEFGDFFVGHIVQAVATEVPEQVAGDDWAYMGIVGDGLADQPLALLVAVFVVLF